MASGAFPLLFPPIRANGRLSANRRHGDAADGSRRRRGRDLDRPWIDLRGDAAAATWIVRGLDRDAAAATGIVRGSDCGAAATCNLDIPRTDAAATTWIVRGRDRGAAAST